MSIICWSNFLSQYHCNAWSMMANCTHIFRTHLLHNGAWQQMIQIPDSQNNCSMCTPFSRTTGSSLSCQWSVDLPMMFGQDFSCRCALCPWDHLGWKLECDTCCAAEPLIYSIINRVQVRAVGGHTESSLEFKKTFFFVCGQYSMAKQWVSL